MEEQIPPPVDVPVFSPLELAIYLLAVVALGASVVALVRHLLRARSQPEGRRDLALLSAVALVTLTGALSLLGPVTVDAPTGPPITCALGESSPAVAQLRGLPDDSVLSPRQRDCRSRARWRTGGAAGLLLVDLAVAAAVLLGTRRRDAGAGRILAEGGDRGRGAGEHG